MKLSEPDKIRWTTDEMLRVAHARWSREVRNNPAVCPQSSYMRALGETQREEKKREQIAYLLEKVRQIDANGWCILTDGSCDDWGLEEALENLTNQVSGYFEEEAPLNEDECRHDGSVICRIDGTSWCGFCGKEWGP